MSRLFQQWRDDIKCVFARDPAARSTLEVLTTYPGVHALLVHRLSTKLWHKGWCFSARFLAYIARQLTNVDIHPGATVGQRFFIDHGACVVIGETAVIGNDVTIYHGVTLGGTTWNKGKRHPTLEDNVMVGTGAKILGPIVVGKGSRVGANSVVVQDVPENCTVVGIPGRVVTEAVSNSSLANGVNLNHHLIPDPVGKAMSCLLERMDALEQALNATKSSQDCQPDNVFCTDDCAAGRAITQELAARRAS